MGRKGQTKHPGVISREDGKEAVLLEIVKSNALFHVLVGKGKLSKTE
jgi:hypothetical protein